MGRERQTTFTRSVMGRLREGAGGFGQTTREKLHGRTDPIVDQVIILQTSTVEYLEACPLATVSNGGGHLPSFLSPATGPSAATALTQERTRGGSSSPRAGEAGMERERRKRGEKEQPPPLATL